MAKNLLLETKIGSLNFINESAVNASGKKYLGRLQGVCAECDEPTRNGRIYSKKLWEKVLSSPTFKEYLDNKCLFGELNHPEDRLETDIKEVAIALSDVKFEGNNDVVATFDILDTPNGRLLKALCDYGSKLGVSSRGGGDVITREGVQYVDEDSYDFMAWDVVALPAVTRARPAVVESVEYRQKALTLKESVAKEVSEATSVAELNSLKRILENVDVPEKDAILESINERVTNMAGETTSASLLEDLNQAIDKSSTLEKEKAELLEKLSAGATREVKLEEDLKKNKSAMRILGEKLDRAEALKTASVTKEAETSKQVTQLTESNARLQEKIKVLEGKRVDPRENKMLTESLSNANKALLESKSQIKLLEGSLNEQKHLAAEELDKANMLVESVKKDLAMKEKIHSKKLTEALTEADNLRKANKLILEKYVDVKCTQNGIDSTDIKKKLSESATLADVDKLVESARSYKLRFGSLPFQVGDRVSVKSTTVNESAPARKVINNDDDNLEGAATLLKITK